MIRLIFRISMIRLSINNVRPLPKSFLQGLPNATGVRPLPRSWESAESSAPVTRKVCTALLKSSNPQKKVPPTPHTQEGRHASTPKTDMIYTKRSDDRIGHWCWPTVGFAPVAAETRQPCGTALFSIDLAAASPMFFFIYNAVHVEKLRRKGIFNWQYQPNLFFILTKNLNKLFFVIFSVNIFWHPAIFLYFLVIDVGIQ